MADTPYYEDDLLAVEPADDDVLHGFRDISDTTESANGTMKGMLWSVYKAIIKAIAATVKLDDLAATDDNIDLDASTSKHGLLLKLGGGTTNYLRADGTWAAPSGSSHDAVTLDATVTDVLSLLTQEINAVDATADKVVVWDESDGKLTYKTIADAGAATTATKLDDFGTPDDNTDLDATASLHGLMSKAYASKLDGIEAGADVTDATNVAAAGAVMESDYDANTILAATTDNTPAALTVGEQTVVGRLTGGEIDALTVSELITLALSAALPENTAIILDAALSADGKYSGIVEAGTAGAALAFGDLVYLAVADSRWELADGNAEATAKGKLGICVLAAAGDGSATTILLWGKVRADAVFPALTVGAPVFVGTTAGDVQTTAPSGAADIIRIVGYGNTADELYFCPSNDFFEHA